MAHFKAVVKEKEQKLNSTWNVKIRVTHNRTIAYMGTNTNVSRKQLNDDFTIRDQGVIRIVGIDIRLYEKKLESISDHELKKWSVKELTVFLKGETQKPKTIDFYKEGKNYIELLKSKDRKKYADSIQTTFNSLEAYTGTQSLPIYMVTKRFLQKYEEWLRDHKEGKVIKKCGNTTIGLYMRNIKTVFNKARGDYNGESVDSIVIKHYPFAKGLYKMPEADEVEPRALSVEAIKRIQDYVPESKLQEQAQAAFFISFFMMGTNMIDLYFCSVPKDGWLTYHRHKIKNKSMKKSKMSIFMQPEILPYYEKFKGRKMAFIFKERYASNETFLTAVVDGLNEIGVALELPESLTSYYARGSWASIGQNKCGFSDEVIDKGLAHTRKEHKMLGKYVEEDWSLINNANRTIIDYYVKETTPEAAVIVDFSI